LANDEGNGLVIWGANGAERNILQVNTGNTQTLTGTVLDENDNTDGFHTFRLAFEAQDGLYYVWRDSVLLTPDGLAKQAATGASRFIVGDCCSGIPMSTVDLAYISYDTTGAFSPMPPKITPLDSAAFELVAGPSDIHDGDSLVNGWVNAGGDVNFELNDAHLSLISAANNGWLQHDNDESVWEKGVADGGSWTAEISIRLANDEGNGLVIWGANGAERNILQVNTHNTQTLTGTVLDENDNTDAFHTFRLAFEGQDGLYYVWRDDVLLTPDGIAKQAGTGANRFIVGDCCSGIPMSTIDLAYIRYDTTGAFSPPPPKITTLGSDGFELVAGPSDIYDGENLINGWVNAGGDTNFELGDGFVSMISAANNGWLQHDNDESVWELGVADGGSWTAEISIRLANDEGNGLVIWGANGAERNILQVNTHNTQTLTGTVLDENDNTDAFHTFRLAFEAKDGLYYVWRDGVLLTPDGIAKQAGTGANRFIVGDCCSGIPMTTIDLEYIRYDTTGAFSPPAMVAAPSLSIVNNGDGTITVTFEGRLEAAASVNGPWQDTGETSPLTIPADQAQQFGRAVK
jgi:hypothetical protein